MITLSVCIPTYNRARHLRNCLNSFLECGLANLPEVQICISDNCSSDNTNEVVNEVKKLLPIKYKVNTSNMGSARNFLEVVAMADGDFVWMLGDDDLLMPRACEKIIELIKNHELVDYFYVNANHLTTEYVESFPQPFELKNLPKKMTPFSSRTESGEMLFLELIDPKVSFDFLGGIFLSVFRRQMWLSHTGCLDTDALADSRVFSHFDNTFPHIKIFANAFSKSLAYFSSDPASVCLTGAREWAPMEPLVMSVRLLEALEAYNANGLKLYSYLYCRNAALSNFFRDVLRLIYNKKESGGDYVNIPKILFKNCIFPNAYLSIFYMVFRKSFWNRMRKIFKSSV